MSDLVDGAYGLTPEEVRLTGATATAPPVPEAERLERAGKRPTGRRL